MSRIFFFLLICLSVSLNGLAVGAPADGLPPRPTPFRFVTDQAHLLSETDANTLESGLRRYADKTGTQLVVVTVPTLGGRNVADYGRALGEAWSVGQRDKNNGLVVLLSGQEHQLTIQAGSGLRDRITPELTNRVINQQMTPDFKQGRYFAGLRTGLNTLMLAVNPSSDPRQDQTAALPGAAAAGAATNPTTTMDRLDEPTTAPLTADPYSSGATAAPEPASSGMGLGMGTILVGVLLVGGVIWLLVRMFRRKNSAAPTATSSTPDFLPTRPSGGGNQATPNFLPTSNTNGPNNNNNSGSGGSGVGSMLATGAAAAAGAYLGNRMSQGHQGAAAPYTAPPANLSSPAAGPAYSGGDGSSEFPALSGAEPAPDYFGPDNSAPDYFSSDDSGSSYDNTSYDDTSSDDTGGGGFDDTSSNSGSW